MPTVSIVIPTYQRIAYLKEAVASVFAQTVADWELIIVDDGSTDGTVEWLESLDDDRVIVIARPHTANKAELRNAGLARARGVWIAFLDSDDRWTPQKLELQLRYHAANEHIRWSYTGRSMIDANGSPLAASNFTAWQPLSGHVLRHVLMLDANIALPSVMVDPQVLRDVGGFNESTRAAEDFELWLRLAEHNEIGLVDKPLLEVRKHRADRFRRPELSLAFSVMFREFSNRTSDESLRDLARTQAAYHAVNACDRLALQRRWPEARGALRVAFGLKPLAPFTYRAAVRLAARRARAAIVRSTEHAA